MARANIATWLTALAIGLIGGPAWSQSAPTIAEPVQIGQIATGYVYYNRPGATLADHNADLGDCIRMTGAANIPTAHPEAVGINGVVGQAVFHAIWDGPVAGIVAVKVENCMIVRGWRAVRLSDEEGAQLAALPAADLIARLTPWIGAQAPHGDIVRVWGNEAARPTDFKLASRAAHPGPDQLSLKIFTPSDDLSPNPSDVAAPVVAPMLDPKWPTRPIDLAGMASAPSGAGFIVVRIRGIGPKGGGGMIFSREGPRPGVSPTIDDHAPDYAVAALGWLYAKREGNWFVFAVPPGRWRIASSGFLSYCLGAPSFEVGSGETVYAGTFDLAGPVIGPDLDLKPAQDYLAATPAPPLRAAAYRNGDRGPCLGFGVIYALEIPGAPFAPGYAWGGALKP